MVAQDELREHQENWWGIQKCRRCNPLGIEDRPHHLWPLCPDCDGSGWTEWAAFATEPWTEIVPNLWIGGHDYTDLSRLPARVTVSAIPENAFDVVVSLYSRPGSEPRGPLHIVSRFEDAHLTPGVKQTAHDLARDVSGRRERGECVLVRCQAGLNRSSLIAGLALIYLGMSGPDAVQLIRTRRSPWALCNEDYAEYLSLGGDVEMVLEGSR